MTQAEQIQAWKDAHPAGPYGFGFYYSQIEQVLKSNSTANGVRIVFGIDENGNQTAYLEPANLPTALSATSGGGLPCPTYCK